MSFALYESARRLPTIPSSFTGSGLRGPHELQLDGDRDVVGEGVAAARDGGVPVDAVGRAVDGGGQLDGDAVLAVEVLRRAGDRPDGLDRLGHAAHGEVALDDELLAVLAQLGRAEGDLGEALGVEEVRALQVALELIDGHVDAGDLDRAGQRGRAG